MNWTIWEKIESELSRRGIKPILAVVPDNQDAKLMVGEARENFWECVRRWQHIGWTIGLHGYQHRYVTQQSGIVGLNARSEFAGLLALEQENKLRQGLAIFERERVHADTWIAPAHSFDLATLQSLRLLGIRVISDGFHVLPYVDADGMQWVPQQLWQFVLKSYGVWTICYHHNSWSSADLDQFRMDLDRYAKQISSMQQIVEQYQHRQMGLLDVLAWRITFGEIQLRGALGPIKTRLMALIKRTSKTISAQ